MSLIIKSKKHFLRQRLNKLINLVNSQMELRMRNLFTNLGIIRTKLGLIQFYSINSCN